MSTKAETMAMAAEGRGCLGKAAADEPVFVLRGQDKFTPDLIEQWADVVEEAHEREGHFPPGAVSKIREARAYAHDIRAWQARNHAKVPE